MTKKIALLSSMLMFVIIINSFQVIFLSELNIQLEVQNNQNLTEFYPPKLSSTPLWNYSTDSNALSVAISANGRYIVAGSQNHMVYFFENSSSQPLWVNGSAGSTLAMSSDGKYIVTIGIEKEIFLFNRSSSTPLWIYPTDNWISNLAISSDGNYIIAGGDSESGNNVYFFNVTNTIDPLLWKYITSDGIRSVAISSNGSYIAMGSEYGNIYLFNKSSSTPIQIWSISGDIDSIAISSNGEYIVAGSRDHNVYLFNRSSPTPIWSYTTGGIVHSVAISSDGNHIVAGGEYLVGSHTIGKVYLFDKSSSTPLWNYTAESNVRSVAISSDGNYLVVGGSGTLRFTKVIHLFQSLYSTPLAKYSISGSYYISVSISSNGDYIAAVIDSNIYLFHKSGFDDEYEENDNFYEAPILTEGIYTDLTLNGIDLDYFGININSNKKIEIEILFDHSFGDLNLYLYDPSQILINSSLSNTNDEYVSYISSSSGIFTILVDSVSDNSIIPYELRIKISVIPYVIPEIVLIISVVIAIIIAAISVIGVLFKERITIKRKLQKRKKQKIYVEQQKVSASKDFEKIVKNVEILKQKALIENSKRNFKKTVKLWEDSIIELNKAKFKASIFNPKLIKGIDNLIKDLKIKVQKVKTSEKEQKMYQALLTFSEKFPRITLRELANRVKLQESEVKNIVLQFIKEKIIPAKYDEASKGIEFQGVMEEIERLLETFDEWDKMGAIKKK